MKLCRDCVNVVHDGETICDECKESYKVENYEDTLDFSDESELYREFESFIKSRSGKSVLYAYSGGQDSTIVLYLLSEMCKKYDVELKLFTVENGFKGKRTWQNIANVIKFLGLEDNHKIYDIREKIVTNEQLVSIFGEGHTTEEIYAMCIMDNKLPCGKICNTMMDAEYKRILKEENEEYLITGGDTPKINNNRYSVFWQKKNGIKVVRGGAGFRISKSLGKDIIKEYKIPWENPNYGGYDTDCLIPGTIFAGLHEADSKTSVEEIMEKFPVVHEYLKERSRLGIISREDAVYDLNNLDINSYSGFVEAKNTAGKVLSRRLHKDV